MERSYRYRPDIIAQTRIPGHCFVHWSFTTKFVPPAVFLGIQCMLVPLIYAKGGWDYRVTLALLATFAVPATTAILGRWFAPPRIVHPILAYSTLAVLAYVGGITGLAELGIILAMNVWFCVYWAIMGAGLSDPLKRMLEILEKAQSGSLSSRVTLNFPRRDELGRVSEGLNWLLDKLERVMKDVSHKAGEVVTSSGSVSTVTSELTVGVEAVSERGCHRGSVRTDLDDDHGHVVDDRRGQRQRQGHRRRHRADDP